VDSVTIVGILRLKTFLTNCIKGVDLRQGCLYCVVSNQLTNTSYEKA